MNDGIKGEKKPWLFKAQVFHQRFIPKSYIFKHNIFYIRFPLSQVDQLKNTLFSINRFNLFSFYTKDHGDRQGGDLRNWVLQKLSLEGIDKIPTEIELQTFPRICGFVFNPVSFWYCYEGSYLFAILVEVNNTFGATYSYVIKELNSECLKQFHVSPFLKVCGSYHFKFFEKEQKKTVSIDYYDQENKILTTHISGVPRSYNLKNLILLWIANPIMTFLVFFYIHLHASLLYLKGVPFIGKKG